MNIIHHILVEARNRIWDPAFYTRGASAREAGNVPVMPTSPFACRWSVHGALTWAALTSPQVKAITDAMRVDADPFDLPHVWIDRAFDALHDANYGLDLRGDMADLLEHDQILRIFDRAIARLK